MSAATGLGLLDVSILEAIDASGARHDQPYLKTRRALDVLEERTGIGPNQAYESLCDMARPYAVHLALVDFHGNYGSPDFGPASSLYTECRLTELGEAVLASERGELGSMPIALINGNLHLGGRRPPLDPRRAIAAIRAAAAGARDDAIVDLVGVPAFASGCVVTGDAQSLAHGDPSEIVASASMTDGYERDRAIVTIAALPPFTSASRIADLIQTAVDHYGRRLPGRPLPPDANELAPVVDVVDESTGARTNLKIVARSTATHADVHRLLSRVSTVHQRMQVEFGQPLVELVRSFAVPSADLESRLALIEQAVRS